MERGTGQDVTDGKRPQDRALQNPTDTDPATEARVARSSRRNAVRAAKQSYTTLKLQATSQAEVWKVLKNMQPAHTRAIPDLNGQAEFAEKCAALRQVLFPPTAGDDIPALRPPAMDLRAE